MKRLLALLLLLSPLVAQQTGGFEPTFAGTMLNFYPRNTPAGHWVFDPVWIYTHDYGLYNSSWAPINAKNIDEIQTVLTIQRGLTNYVDINLILNGFYSAIGSHDSVRFGDINLLLGFQILHDRRGSWQPDLRLLVGESFPTGKYQNLDPNKDLSDASGTGSYETSLILVIQKIFYAIENHPFNLNLNLFYIYSTKTTVEGPNIYGGGKRTHAVVNPGDQYIASLGFEIKLTDLWEAGLNISYEHQDRSTFTSPFAEFVALAEARGRVRILGLPSSELITMAPSIQYNLTERLSLGGGLWFSVAGRNSSSFVGAMFDLIYYL